MRMTGKEDWEKKYREEIEEVNLRADMLCVWNDELENKLSKYERAFEILKRHNLSIGKNANTETGYYIHCESELLTDEYELLEELMKDVQ
jgi:hypothetical protein